MRDSLSTIPSNWSPVTGLLAQCWHACACKLTLLTDGLQYRWRRPCRLQRVWLSVVGLPRLSGKFVGGEP